MNRWIFTYRYQCFTCSLIISTRACCLCWWTGEFFCIQVSVLHLLFDICLPEHAAWADGQVSFFAYRYQCFTCSLIFVYQSMLLGLMDRWVFLHTGISASPALWYLSTRACCLGWWTGEFFTDRYQGFTCSLILSSRALLTVLMDRWIYYNLGVCILPAVWHCLALSNLQLLNPGSGSNHLTTQTPRQWLYIFNDQIIIYLTVTVYFQWLDCHLLDGDRTFLMIISPSPWWGLYIFNDQIIISFKVTTFLIIRSSSPWWWPYIFNHQIVISLMVTIHF